MAVERYASKTDVVVKLVLVFFISLLSFSIGTFVGKKFSDNQHKLSQLEPGHGEANAETATETAATDEHGAAAHGERSVASIAHDVTDVKPNKALTDDEIAKLAEEFVTDDDAKDAHKDAHKETKLEASNHEPKHDAHRETASVETTAPAEHKTEHKAEPAHEPEHAAAPVATKKAEPSSAAKKVAAGHDPAHVDAKEKAEKHEPVAKAPTALPKEMAASATGKFTVQVASYPKEEEAQNMSNELKNKGFSAFYIPAKIKGDTWYRVSVGLFTTQKEAQAYRNDLLARAKVSSAIVQQIAK